LVVHHPEHILVDDGLQLLQHLAFHGHLALQVVAHQTVAEGIDAPHALAIKLEDVAVFGILVDAIDIVDGIGILARWGYDTAFFHGANRGSMGFLAFAKKIGFKNYYGRQDYAADPRFGGDKDFDGNWGIWDEPFMVTMPGMPALRSPTGSSPLSPW
jgi:hypothetical protein